MRPSLVKARTISCVDGDLEAWVGSGCSCRRSRTGGAQVLLSSSFGTLSLSLPCLNLPHSSTWLLAKEGVQGKQRSQRVTLPEENPRRHVRTERNPSCQPEQLQANMWSRCELTHCWVRQERGSQPQPNLEALQGNQSIEQLEKGREQDGSALKRLGTAQENFGRLLTAILTPDELRQPP